MTRLLRRLPVAFALILIAAVGIFAALDKSPVTPLKSSPVGYGYGGANNPATYVPIAPKRLCDTRGQTADAAGSVCGTTPLGANEVRPFNVTSGGFVPPTAFAVVMNVISVSPSEPTFVSVYAPGSQPTPPHTSNINGPAGSILADLVTVATAGDGSGTLDAYNYAGSTDLVIDIEGYYVQAPGTGLQPGEYHPVTPTRVCDTRTGFGPCGGALAAGAAVAIQVAPSGGTASAALFNLTATRNAAQNYLTVTPAGTGNACSVAPPHTSSLDGATGVDQANRVLSETNGNGFVCLFNPSGSGTVDYIIDLNGWFGSGTESSAGLQFQPTDAFRICDTRSGMGTECSGLTLGGPSAIAISVAGVDGIPAMGTPATSPQVVSANVTGVLGTMDTYFVLYKNGTSRPNTSDLNPTANEIVANAGYVALSSKTGAFNLFNWAGNIDALVDVSGWFVNAGP